MEELWLPTEIESIVGAGVSAHRAFQGVVSDTVMLTSERGTFVLKRGHGKRRAAELAAEHRVLNALTEYRPFVPEPLAFTMDGEEGILLLSRLEGENLVEALNDVDEAGKHALVSLHAWALRRVHDWTPNLAKPLDWLDRTLARAERRLSRGDIRGRIEHPGQFKGVDARELIAWLRRIQPTIRSDLVFCHGDACMPNVMVENARVTGVVDWSRGAYADRRSDLATACWSVGYNLGSETYQSTFLKAYEYSRDAVELEPFEALYALE